MKGESEEPVQAAVSRDGGHFFPAASATSPSLAADTPQTMVAMLLGRAARHCDSPAVEYEGNSLTYAELASHTERWAGRLRDRGVGDGSRVVLLLERSMDFIVALFATWRAGATAVPVDPAVPRQRLASLLDDCTPCLMLISGRAPCDGDFSVPILRFVAEGETPSSQACAWDLAAPDRAAYCLYTSGSTGRPKGVLISHRSLSHYAAMSAGRLGLAAADRILQICSPGFDMVMQEICGAIAAGACIVIYPHGRDVSTLALDDFIIRHRVSVAIMPTALWRIWVAEHAWAGQYLPTCLRVVKTGGEKIEQLDFEAWRSLGGAGAPLLVNGYGPTETTMSATMWLYAAGDNFTDDDEVPIGTANGGYSCHVIDDLLRPVPDGAIGQLAIGGMGVGIGYLGRPAETAAAFVPDPFAAQDGLRMYLTGDRVRRNDAGQLEFVGRADAQVKILGYRVEPGEIECALREHPDIANAAVVARDLGHGKQLAAFCQPRPGSRLDSTALREWIAQRLPPYMVPAQIEVLDALPITVGGKLDRRALAMHGAPAESAVSPVETPADMLDAQLAAIWKLTLGVDRVAADDNFFDCGGHSLLVTKFIWAVKKATDLELGYQDVFADPSYSAILLVLRERFEENGGVASRPERGADNALDGWVPVTFQQRRLLNQAEEDFATAVRVAPVMLELSGALDADRLQRAVDRTLSRHDVFRLRFARTPTGFEQRPANAVPEIPSERREIPPGTADPQAAALELGSAWAYRGMDVMNGEFVRTMILTSDASKAWLVIALHHIAVDAQSVHVLISEILGGYARDAPTGPRESLYLQYAKEQAARVESGAYARDLAYWADYLDGVPPLLLPRTAKAARAEQPAPRLLTEILDGMRLDRLRVRATEEKTTLFALCLGALNILLADVTGQDDILTGIPHHNRPGPEYRDCVGYFVNSLPMRMAVRGRRSVGSLIASVTAHLEEAPRHLGVTMADVALPVDPRCSRLFQAMVVNDQVSAYGAVHGLEVERLRPAAPVTKCDLTVGIIEQPDRLRLGFLFDPALLDDAEVSRWLSDYVGIIDRLAAHEGALDSLTIAAATGR